MTKILITGRFDNGHNFYYVDTEIDVDTSKTAFSDSDIINIVNQLERADRQLHGRSYRGQVTSFDLADEELDRRFEQNHITFELDEPIYQPGFEWLKHITADKKRIQEALIIDQ